MKRSLSVICSLLLFTFAITVPIDAAVQTEENVIIEEDQIEGIENESVTYSGTIQIDGSYSDWNHIPHTDISWYLPDPNQVHQGALFLDGDILYGHYKMNDAYKMQMGVNFMDLTVNGKEVGLTIQKRTEGDNYDWNMDMNNLPLGVTTGLGVFYIGYPKYYLGEAAFTVFDSNHLIGDEVEFAIDLNVVSKITEIPVESMREIKLFNPSIGSQNIVIAGSSSGTVLGVILMVVVASGGVLCLKRKSLLHVIKKKKAVK
jgi:uncharacterized protein (TIGR04145 family)